MIDNNRKYLLVIKRNNNDYLPLEWNLTSLYEGEDLNTLEGIDKFTKKTTKVELLTEVLKENMVDSEEKYMDFSIIYYEKGKVRELKEGTIFKSDETILSEDDFILTILSNINNKSILNNLYNACCIKNKDQHLEEFKFILKTIDYFIKRGNNATYAALLTFKNISYENKRTIIIKMSKKINDISYDLNNQLTKKENTEIEGKVA